MEQYFRIYDVYLGVDELATLGLGVRDREGEGLIVRILLSFLTCMIMLEY